jgi:excisionase family DNA binding protein
MTEQIFLTMRETCARLRVSRQTVYNLIRRGKLKQYKREIGQGIGGVRTLFDAAEVDALGTVTPALVEIGEQARTRTTRRTRKTKARRGSASK